MEREQKCGKWCKDMFKTGKFEQQKGREAISGLRQHWIAQERTKTSFDIGCVNFLCNCLLMVDSLERTLCGGAMSALLRHLATFYRQTLAWKSDASEQEGQGPQLEALHCKPIKNKLELRRH